VALNNCIQSFVPGTLDVQKLGKELTLDALLTGRVVQRGDTIQVSADLTNVRDNTEIWGEQYERKRLGHPLLCNSRSRATSPTSCARN
jgi:TolB-like protein